MKESERERDRTLKKAHIIPYYTRRSQQTLDLIHCQCKLNQISHTSAQGAEIHHSRVGERDIERVGGGVGGENKRVKGPVSECER